MVRTNIESVIPLVGPGFQAGYDGAQKPAGSFRSLINAEVTNKGSLKNRRSVSPLLNSKVMDKVHRVTGNWFDTLVLNGGNGEDMFIANNTGCTVWPYFTALEMGLGGLTAQGFVTWLDKYYVISNTSFSIAGTDTFDIKVSEGTLPSKYQVTGANARTSLSAKRYATDTTVTVASDAVSLGYSGQRLAVSAYKVFRDRLWIAAGDTVYFSEAGDFTVWTAPTGGFVKFPGSQINDIVGYRDSMYIICDNAIYVVKYTFDPNDVDDLSVVLITDSIGADSAVLHQDAIYFERNDLLYAINNDRVEIVQDLYIGTAGVNSTKYAVKLTSWLNYLIIHKHKAPSVSGAVRFSLKSRLSATSIEPNVFFLNTDNGSLHQFDFNDLQGGSSYPTSLEFGYPVDFYVNPATLTTNSQPLMIVSAVVDYNNNRATLSTLNYMNSGAYLDDGAFTETFVDVCLQGNSASTTKVQYRPNVDIQIDSFVPDGHEYLVKKFKNLLLEGRFPYNAGNGLFLYLDYNSDIDWPVGPINLFTYIAPPLRFPNPLRIGLNQRGRSISIRLKMDSFANLLSNVNQVFEISDIRLYWTYTGRAPEFSNA